MSEEEVNPATAVPQQQQQIVPAVPGAGEEETVKCFVGQVPRAYEEAELRQLFEPYGTVVDTSVIRHKETGQHRGCAFVVFASKQFADNAITALHESQVLPGMTHKLQVKYADGELERLVEHKLFIGRVPSTVEEEEIKQIFSGYGEVEEVTILHDAAGNSKNCGFVRLKNRAQANAAIAGLNEIYQFPGTSNRMVVKFADTAKQKEMRKRQAMQQAMFANPYMYQNVAAFGANPMMASAYAGMATTGYGQAGGSQMQALLATQGAAASYYQAAGKTGMGRGTMAQGMTQGMGQAMGYGATAARTSLPSQTEGPAGCNLFLLHLPQEWTDADLIQNFSPFGTLVSARVFIDKMTGLSRCFGFVSYDNAQSAQSAIANMNGLQVGHKRLKVELKKSRGASSGSMYMGSRPY